VDRLDYTKGIEHRLKAYRELLGEGRLSNREVALVQVATPSRQRVAQYRELRERVEREVGRINGEFGEVGIAPVHYLFRSYDREELLALYLAADVMVVTPLRDGMNLVAKEYVAARADDTGALVLSEFTGAAAELPEAFLVNPHDVDEIKQALLDALNAPAEERSARMKRMREHVCAYDVRRWAHDFLEALGEEV
jgi:trehalose 6-phosphate synthase